MSKLQPAKIALGLFLLSAFIGRKQLAQTEVLKSPIARTAFWFFAMVAFSGTYSIWQSNSLEFVLNGLIVIMIVFVLLFKVARNWHVVEALLVSLCVSAAALGAVAILRYDGTRAEASGTYDTNDLAYVLVTTLPLALAFALDGRGLRRLLIAGMAGTMIIATLLTESRGGLLGLIAGVVAVIWLRPVAVNTHTGEMGRVAKAIVWGAIALIIAFASWPLLPSSSRERFESMLDLQSDYNLQEESVGRTFIWKRNLKAVAGRPIGFGVGSSSALDLRLGGRYKTAHNSVVQIITELGVFGVILFLRLYWLAWRLLGESTKNLRSQAAIVPGDGGGIAGVILYGLRASLVASFVAGFFLSQGYSYLLYSLLGIVAAVVLLDPAAKSSGVGVIAATRRHTRLAR
ncbi:MAG: O-antigen ligase family protein [Steroidobacteraceae bacterium]